jgi:DHA1 family bicyclomycin/chloramphenicol resistance-like MFS transporter
LGSIFTLFANTFPLMLWGRLLQGLGSGGCFVLGTAIVFDAFKEEEAIKAVSKLNAAIPFVMAFAPMLGGYLNYTYGFRANFLAIAFFVGLSFLICLFQYEETLPKEKRTVFSLQQILKDFRRAFTNVAFCQITVALSLFFAGYLVFLSISAVLFVKELGVSKQLFPFFQGAILTAFLVATLPFDRLLDRWGKARVKNIGNILSWTGAIGFGLAAWLAPTNPYLLTLPMLLYSFGLNWVMAIYFPEAMAILPDIKGIAGSLLTSIRMLITVGVVATASSFYDKTVFPLAVTIVAIAVSTILLVYCFERRQNAPATT